MKNFDQNNLDAGSADSSGDVRNVSSANFNATDLDWLAACYVWGEMDALQQAVFERRLAEDTAACEAVARAIELSDSVAAACVQVDATHTALCESTTTREAAAGHPTRFRRRKTWSQRVIWMSVGAAACLAVVTAGQSWLARHGGAPIVQDVGPADEAEQFAILPAETRSSDDDSSSLALAWTESQGVGGDVWAEAYSAPVASTNHELTARIDSDSPMDVELAAPDWLVAAVSDASDARESSNSAPSDRRHSIGPQSIGPRPNRSTPN